MKYLFSSQNESGLCRKYVSAGHMEGESPLRSNVINSSECKKAILYGFEN